MFAEARLDITLRILDGLVAEVAVRSSRLVRAAAMFAGRHPDEVTHLLPTIFALCGTAQAQAGQESIEAAAGFRPSLVRQRSRRLMLLAETIAEHGLGMAREWPALMDAPPDLDAARRLKTAMVAVKRALYPQGDWNRPGGGRLTPNAAALGTSLTEANQVIAQLLGAPLEQILLDVASFEAWLDAGGSNAARLLAWIRGENLAGFGRNPFQPMPEQGPADLAARLENDRNGQYLAAPDSAGRVFETGPLARCRWHPLIAALAERHGNGILTRLAARLVELHLSLQEMAELMQDLAAEDAPVLTATSGSGLGLVEAARGLLAHRVELEDGRVKRYQILAPTEWNFHPHGPFARGLAGAAASPLLKRQAQLLAHALDPCVACAVSVE